MLQVLGWTSLELIMTCLHLLYKMSGGQIGIVIVVDISKIGRQFKEHLFLCLP